MTSSEKRRAAENRLRGADPTPLLLVNRNGYGVAYVAFRIGRQTGRRSTLVFPNRIQDEAHDPALTLCAQFLASCSHRGCDWTFTLNGFLLFDKRTNQTKKFLVFGTASSS